LHRLLTAVAGSGTAWLACGSRDEGKRPTAVIMFRASIKHSIKG
jgi:hypothetical protein